VKLREFLRTRRQRKARKRYEREKALRAEFFASLSGEPSPNDLDWQMRERLQNQPAHYEGPGLS